MERSQSGQVAVLDLRRVSKRFGTFAAVDDLSLVVAPGEFLTLLGASGSGKTTTLRMVAGFELPSSGEILMDGAPITRLPPFKRDVNTVFQHYALFPHMSVRTNVGYGLRMRGVPKSDISKRVDEALEMVQLSALGDRAPRQLSGGQQQRVALARALVNRPRVLLLDEPLGALDLKLRKEMQLELKALNKQLGITFLYVTHDQEEALTMSDRIALMRGGRIEQLGGARDMYERPASRYVASFIGETNLLQGVARGTDGGLTVMDAAGTQLRATATRSFAQGTECWLSVRPEFMHAERADGSGNGTKPGENSLTGIVKETIFVGALSKLHIALPGGGMLVVHVAAGAEPAHPGEAVRASWPAERGICVGD